MKIESRKDLQRGLDNISADSPSAQLWQWYSMAVDYDVISSDFADPIYKRLIQIDYQPAVYTLGDKFQDQERRDEAAIMLYHKASKLGHAPSARYLGELYRDLGNTEQSIYYFLESKQLSNSQDVIAMNCLATLFSSCGLKGRASQLIQEIAKVDLDAEYIAGCEESEQIIQNARRDIGYLQGSQVGRVGQLLPIFYEAYEDYFKPFEIKPIDCFYKSYPEGSTMLGFGEVEKEEFFALRTLSHKIAHWVVGFIDRQGILNIFDGNGDNNETVSGIPRHIATGEITSMYPDVVVHSMVLQANIGVNACGYICRYMIDFFREQSFKPDTSTQIEQEFIFTILGYIKDKISKDKDINLIDSLLSLDQGDVTTNPEKTTTNKAEFVSQEYKEAKVHADYMDRYRVPHTQIDHIGKNLSQEDLDLEEAIRMSLNSPEQEPDTEPKIDHIGKNLSQEDLDLEEAIRMSLNSPEQEPDTEPKIDHIGKNSGSDEGEGWIKIDAVD